MDTGDAKMETLTQSVTMGDNGSETVIVGDDGARVSENCKKGFYGDMGSDNGGVVLVESGVTETEVSADAVMDVGEESKKGLDSALGVEKGEENDLVISKGYVSDRKVIYSESAVPQTAIMGDGVKVSEICNKGVNDNIGSEDRGVMVVKKGVLETEISVDAAVMGVREEIEKGLNSVLGVEKGEENGIEKIGAENDRSASNGDGSLPKVGVEHIHKKGGVDADEGNNDEDEDEDDDDVGDEDHEYHVGDFVWGKIRSFPWWPGQIYDPSDASDYALKLKQKDRILVAYFGDGSFSWCKPSQLKPFVENFEEMSKQSNSKSFVNAVEKALDEIGRLVELEMTCPCFPEKNQLRDARPFNGGVKKGVLVPMGGIGKFLVSQHEPKEVIAILRNVAQTVSINNMLELTVLKNWLTAYYRAKGGYKLPVYHYPKGIEGLEDKSRDALMNTTDPSNPVEIHVQAQGPSEEDWFSSPAVAVGHESGQSSSQKCTGKSRDILYQRRKQKSVADLMDELMDVELNEKNGSLVNGTNSDKLRSGKKRKKKGSEGSEKQEKKSLMASESSMKKGRKKKVESPRTAEKKGPTVEVTDDGDEEFDEIPLSRELARKKLCSDGDDENEAKEENIRSLASREKKKSRYLSPPYTNPIWKMKVSSCKRDSEKESEKDNKVPRLGERMAKVAGQLIGSKIPGSSTFQSELPEELGSDLETATLIHLLSQVRSAALDPLSLREKSCLDFMTENISAFRNTTLMKSNYGVNQKVESGSRKRKSLQECLNSADHEISELSPQQTGNGFKDQDFEMPPTKKAASVSEKRTNDEDAERKAAPVALILTFPPAFPLPSKDEIIKIFSKFGALNEMETDVLYNSYCARVSYLRSSDAEEAFKASVDRKPFGTANVNYRLRYPSAAARVHEKPSLENAIAFQPSNDEAEQVGYVREKLRIMTSMLENCDGRISMEMKSNLEGEIKGLLEKVSTMTVTS